MKVYNFSHPLSEDAKKRIVELTQTETEDFSEEIFKFQINLTNNVAGQVLQSVIKLISKVANEKYIFDREAREEDAFLIILPALSIAAGIFAAMLQNAVDSMVIPDCGLVVIKSQPGVVNTVYQPENVFWLNDI